MRAYYQNHRQHYRLPALSFHSAHTQTIHMDREIGMEKEWEWVSEWNNRESIKWERVHSRQLNGLIADTTPINSHIFYGALMFRAKWNSPSSFPIYSSVIIRSFSFFLCSHSLSLSLSISLSLVRCVQRRMNLRHYHCRLIKPSDIWLWISKSIAKKSTKYARMKIYGLNSTEIQTWTDKKKSTQRVRERESPYKRPTNLYQKQFYHHNFSVLVFISL